MKVSIGDEIKSCNCSFPYRDTQCKHSFIQINLFKAHLKIHSHRLQKRELRPPQQLNFFSMLYAIKNFHATSSCLTKEKLNNKYAQRTLDSLHPSEVSLHSGTFKQQCCTQVSFPDFFFFFHSV